MRACAHCHGGPGQSTTLAPVVRYHDIFSQCPRPVDTVSPARFALDPCPPQLARNARTYEITLGDGTRVRRTSSDPGRALSTGFVGGVPAQDDWNKFDVPGLRGLRRTAPYFHNNSAATLEDVVDHYTEFFMRVRLHAPPGVVPPVAQHRRRALRSRVLPGRAQAAARLLEEFVAGDRSDPGRRGRWFGDDLRYLATTGSRTKGTMEWPKPAFSKTRVNRAGDRLRDTAPEEFFFPADWDGPAAGSSRPDSRTRR